MRALLTVLWLGAAACSPDPAPVPVEQVDDDPGLLLGDLQHLLREAVAAHGAGDLALAERRWAAAADLWRHRIGPGVRAHDRLRALSLEYDLGRFGDALRRRGGGAGERWRALDRALSEVAPWLTPPNTPTETPASPLPDP